VIVVAVVNMKGGTSKTTSAVFLAHVFHDEGLPTMLIDADPQETAVRWMREQDSPVSTVALSVPDLDLQLDGITGSRFDVVVIDTPPNDELVVRAALRAATHVVVPMAPTPPEYERLEEVRRLIAKATSERGDEGPTVAVLLTRTPTSPNASATRAYRELVESDGVRVLATQVKFLQRFALAKNSAVLRAGATAYGDAVDDLLGLTADENETTGERR